MFRSWLLTAIQEWRSSGRGPGGRIAARAPVTALLPASEEWLVNGLSDRTAQAFPLLLVQSGEVDLDEVRYGGLVRGALIVDEARQRLDLVWAWPLTLGLLDMRSVGDEALFAWAMTSLRRPPSSPVLDCPPLFRLVIAPGWERVEDMVLLDTSQPTRLVDTVLALLRAAERYPVVTIDSPLFGFASDAANVFDADLRIRPLPRAAEAPPASFPLLPAPTTALGEVLRRAIMAPGTEPVCMPRLAWGPGDVVMLDLRLARQLLPAEATKLAATAGTRDQPAKYALYVATVEHRDAATQPWIVRRDMIELERDLRAVSAQLSLPVIMPRQLLDDDSGAENKVLVL